MPNTITPGLLTDTLNLIQLARETALAQGKQHQAQKFDPVVDSLKGLVQTSRSTPAAPAQHVGMMAQGDFSALLDAARSTTPGQRVSGANSLAEKQQMVRSMASANMLDVDIARQLGMTVQEVRQVVSMSTRSMKAGG
jgi:tRNA(Phe) wybutosine-synthesizing methylase Tyw3